MTIFLRCFQKIAEEGTLSNSFLWSHHHPDTKTRERQHTKKKTTSQYHWWTQIKILNKIIANRIQIHIKSSYTVIKLGLFQGSKDSSIYANQSMLYTILTNWKNHMIKNHMIFSYDMFDIFSNDMNIICWYSQQMQKNLSQNSGPIYD